MARFLLELSQRVYTSFLKTKIICADQTPGTMPVVEWIDFRRGIQAVFVVAILTPIANKKLRPIVLGCADFTNLDGD